MSETQHKEDQDAGLSHLSSESADGSGGKCLNRHIGRKKEDSCSHIWQAFLRMHEDDEYYNWPRYESISSANRSRIKGAYKAANPKNPNAPSSLSAPAEKAWDIPEKDKFGKSGTNFSICYLPYWHEAHHIIPNSTLRKAIEKSVASASDPLGYKKIVRKSLLDEEFNLNYQQNMIMLPMNATVGEAMSLPLHRQTPQYWSHESYSNHVLGELKNIFKEVEEKSAEHEQDPNIKKVKIKLNKLSGRLRDAIFSTSKKSLDKMQKNEFKEQDSAM